MYNTYVIKKGLMQLVGEYQLLLNNVSLYSPKGYQIYMKIVRLLAEYNHLTKSKFSIKQETQLPKLKEIEFKNYNSIVTAEMRHNVSIFKFIFNLINQKNIMKSDTEEKFKEAKIILQRLKHTFENPELEKAWNDSFED